MQVTEADMTIFYRRLANVELQQNLSSVESVVFESGDFLADAFYQPLTAEQQQVLIAWLADYRKRLQQDWVVYGRTDSERRAQMNSVNPKYVLRNYLAQQAIDKANEGDFSEVETLLTLLRHPYDEQVEFDHYSTKRPEWAKNRAGCSMLSCSS
jgi:uncharacterized protein YdiU (UPF0061 family)